MNPRCSRSLFTPSADTSNDVRLSFLSSLDYGRYLDVPIITHYVHELDSTTVSVVHVHHWPPIAHRVKVTIDTEGSGFTTWTFAPWAQGLLHHVSYSSLMMRVRQEFAWMGSTRVLNVSIDEPPGYPPPDILTSTHHHRHAFVPDDLAVRRVWVKSMFCAGRIDRDEAMEAYDG